MGTPAMTIQYVAHTYTLTSAIGYIYTIQTDSDKMYKTVENNITKKMRKLFLLSRSDSINRRLSSLYTALSPVQGV